MLQPQKKQVKEEKKPFVISHRGFSSMLPQNTKQAIIAGFHFSDFVQFDVLLTKDEQLIVFHDRGLKRLTNINQFKQYSDRKIVEDMDGKGQKQKDWWVRDFTLKQLKKLKVRQPHKHRPQLKNNFEISTLSQIIESCLSIKLKSEQKDSLNCGLLIELKSQKGKTTTSRDKILCEKVLGILNKLNLQNHFRNMMNKIPIIVQSFNLDIVDYVLKNSIFPVVELYNKQIQITDTLLRRQRIRQIYGIGITWQNLCKRGANHSNGQECIKNGQSNQSQATQLCIRFKCKLFVWTVKDDEQSKPLGFENYNEVYGFLEKLGVDGIITEFPDKCRAVIGRQSMQYISDKEQLAEKCLRKHGSSSESPKPFNNIRKTISNQ